MLLLRNGKFVYMKQNDEAKWWKFDLYIARHPTVVSEKYSSSTSHICHIMLMCDFNYFSATKLLRENGRDLTQFNDISPNTHRKTQKATWQHTNATINFYFSECHCWWTRKSPRAHVAKFFGRLRLIRSVLRPSKFSVLTLIEIVMFWGYYTIPFGFSLFCHILDITFQLLKLLCLAKITDEGSLPEMHLWSILLIKSDLKWSLFIFRLQTDGGPTKDG